MMEERRMTVKLRRVFNLFSKSFLYYTILPFALCFVIGKISGIDFLSGFLSSFFVACGIVLWFFYPKEFLIKKNWIEYRRLVTISYYELFRRARGIPVKATYTIWLVKKIELCQSPLEKKLGVGHIRVYGNTEVQVKRDLGDYVKVPEPHVLYGIPNFEEFRRQAPELLGETVEIVSNIE